MTNTLLPKPSRYQVVSLAVCPKCGSVDALRIIRTMRSGVETRRYGHCRMCKIRFISSDLNGVRTIRWGK